MTLQTLLTTQKEKAREAFEAVLPSSFMGNGSREHVEVNTFAVPRERLNEDLDSLISSTAKAVLEAVRKEVSSEGHDTGDVTADAAWNACRAAFLEEYQQFLGENTK